MTATLKVHIALFLFIAAMLAMAARLVQLEAEEKDFLQDQGDARTIRMQKINAHRGMILDRRGDHFAVSSPVVSLWTNPAELPSDDDRIRALASGLGLALALDRDVASARALPPSLASALVLALAVALAIATRQEARLKPEPSQS